MKGLPILLLDPSLERASDTCFLLQLANYRPELVHKDDEAFNWLVSRVESIDQTNLLLINDFHPGMPILRMLAPLREQGVLVPILFIDRRDDRSPCASFEVPLAGIYCCRPENMLSQLRRLTDDLSDSRHDRAGPVTPQRKASQENNSPKKTLRSESRSRTRLPFIKQGNR